MYKSIFTSKTVWLAVLQGALGVVLIIQAQYPEAGQMLILKSLLDIGIRGLTTT